MKKVLCAVLALCLLYFCGCSNEAQTTMSFLGVTAKVQLWGKHSEKVMQELDGLFYQLHDTWSSTDNSAILAVNVGTDASAEMQAVMKKSRGIVPADLQCL